MTRIPKTVKIINMKIRVVSSKNEINLLRSDDKFVHLTFRPSRRDILKLVHTCPNLKTIYIARSSRKTLSNLTLKLLEKKKISLVKGNLRETKFKGSKTIRPGSTEVGPGPIRPGSTEDGPGPIKPDKRNKP